ncbi:asialoglycoprotein receptor 1-like [Alligator sinensis]|uniref:Asialoglycoprotein receptor 1-like n=1 Tax=Alligator sinensis TaxID=38654 RepID=A0A3Q0HL95_ALLSI|nr:asialoglycoprotein receptor 1-like [Alligator sinensis]
MLVPWCCFGRLPPATLSLWPQGLGGSVSTVGSCPCRGGSTQLGVPGLAPGADGPMPADWQQEQRLQQVDMVLVQAQAGLAQTQAELVHMQEQARDLQEQLSTSESARASAQPCHFTDCCPETWVLHRGKCLFLSKEKKTWLESKQACEQESSWLLVPSDWDHTTMPSFLAHMDTLYWIGLQWRWDLKTQSDHWQWLDGSPYKWHGSAKAHGYFGTIKGGRIERGGHAADKHRWICEKPAVCP